MLCFASYFRARADGTKRAFFFFKYEDGRAYYRTLPTPGGLQQKLPARTVAFDMTPYGSCPILEGKVFKGDITGFYVGKEEPQS